MNKKLLAMLLLVLFLVSCGTMQRVQFSQQQTSAMIETNESNGSISGQKNQSQPMISTHATSEQPNGCLSYESNSECSVRMKSLYDSTALQKIPQRYLDEVKTLLRARYGDKIFDNAITIRGVILPWSYETLPLEIGSRTDPLYDLVATVDFSTYINSQPRLNDYDGSDSWSTDFYYKDNGGREIDGPILDCTKNPEFCPPYNISDYQTAIDIYHQACKCNATVNSARFSFEKYVTNQDITSQVHKAAVYRPIWLLKDLSCRPYRGTYWCDSTTLARIDPKTGAIINTPEIV